MRVRTEARIMKKNFHMQQTRLTSCSQVGLRGKENFEKASRVTLSKKKKRNGERIESHG